MCSGNLQSSNQPHVEELDLTPSELLTRYNREWHVVVKHSGISETYERFIEWDMQQARPLQAGADELSLPDIEEPLHVAATSAAAVRNAKLFDSKTMEFENIKVQPMLTPDNYLPEVLKV